MDRSFLSQRDVIAASRNFVCVRLMTYEDPIEAEFLKSLVRTRSSDLENTVFSILAPDGIQPLVHSSRSTSGTFRDARQMVESMNRIATQFVVKNGSDSLPPLPIVPSVRLAINVAAADNLPLVVVFAENPADRTALEQRLGSLAWGSQFIGRLIYASSSDAKELATIPSGQNVAGFLVVQPDRFGTSARVLAQIPASATVEELTNVLTRGLSMFKPESKSLANHVRSGKRQGILWQTAIPVTDPEEQRARTIGHGARP